MVSDRCGPEKGPDDRESIQVARNDSRLGAGPKPSSLGPCWAYRHVELIDRFVVILTQQDKCRDFKESQNLTTIDGPCFSSFRSLRLKRREV